MVHYICRRTGSQGKEGYGCEGPCERGSGRGESARRRRARQRAGERARAAGQRAQPGPARSPIAARLLETLQGPKRAAASPSPRPPASRLRARRQGSSTTAPPDHDDEALGRPRPARSLPLQRTSHPQRRAEQHSLPARPSSHTSRTPRCAPAIRLVVAAPAQPPPRVLPPADLLRRLQGIPDTPSDSC